MLKTVPSLTAIAISAALFNPAYADDASKKAEDELEVMVVSGTRTEKALKDVSGSISVITAEDIDRNVVSDMNQLFQYDPSIQVTGDEGREQNIVVRGMGGDRVLIIKDGMRVNEGYGAQGLNDLVGRGFIETETLKQVEVAKGAYSSIYGADALGGIVVFTTKDASDYLADGEKFGGKVTFGHSSNSRQANGSITLAQHAGDFQHFVNFVRRDGSEAQNFNKTRPELDIVSTSLLYKAKYDINTENSLSFIADLWEQETNGKVASFLSYFRKLASSGYKITKESSDTEKYTNSFQIRYQSTMQTPMFDNLDVNLYHKTTSEKDIGFGHLDIDAPLFGRFENRDMWKTGHYKQETTGLLTHASLELGSFNTLGYGIDIETTESSRTVKELRKATKKAPGSVEEITRDLVEDKFPKNETRRLGIFLNDEIRLVDDKLVITPSVRFDRYEMNPNGALKKDKTPFTKIEKSNVSFNFGTLYHFNDDLAAYFQYGQGFKVPAFDLAYIQHELITPIFAYKILPNGDLKPETSDTYEIGLRGHVGDLAFSSAIYYNKYDDFLDTRLVSEVIENLPGGQTYERKVFTYGNIDSVTIKGAELKAKYFFSDDLNVFANAAYIDGKDDNTKEYLATINPLSGVAGVNYEWNDLNTQLVMNWAKRMTKVNKGKVETAGWVTFDLQAGYKFNDNLSLNISVKNLLDKEYVRYNRVANKAANADLNNSTEAGRNFSAKLSLRF